MSVQRMISAYLKPDSPFYEIFEYGVAPIKSLVPQKVTLMGDADLSPKEEDAAYFLAWDACKVEQQHRLAQKLAELRGGTAKEVLHYMEHGGEIPIRVSQTNHAQASLRAFV